MLVFVCSCPGMVGVSVACVCDSGFMLSIHNRSTHPLTTCADALFRYCFCFVKGAG